MLLEVDRVKRLSPPVPPPLSRRQNYRRKQIGDFPPLSYYVARTGFIRFSIAFLWSRWHGPVRRANLAGHRNTFVSYKFWPHWKLKRAPHRDHINGRQPVRAVQKVKINTGGTLRVMDYHTRLPASLLCTFISCLPWLSLPRRSFISLSRMSTKFFANLKALKIFRNIHILWISDIWSALGQEQVGNGPIDLRRQELREIDFSFLDNH